MDRHTVVLADDHHLVRAGLRSLIEDYDAYEVVGEAGDGRGAVELSERLHPAVTVLDVTMPRLGGIEATPQIKEVSPRTKVLILSMYATRDFVLQALHAGADGYLLKDAAAVELALALDALCTGQRYLSPAVSSAVVEHALSVPMPLGDPLRPPPVAAPAGDMPLTPRQVEILKLLASGKSAKEAAYELGLSVKTVETHRAQIMERLGIRDVPRLVLYALRQGLISPEGRH
jgi:DNA-binding NarL/FixJ family response regulator